MQSADAKANIVIEALIQLNQLEEQLASDPENAELKAQIETERAKIPRPVQGHHDRIRVKGRSSVAAVRTSESSNKWVCGNCFIEIPRGMHSKIQLRNDIALCESCGVYLYTNQENS